MFESLGFETLTAPQAAIWLGLILGLAFGVLAERTRFCFRRALVGEDRRQAGGVWAMALAFALIGTQAAVLSGLITFSDHRFMAGDLPILSILVGGALFGAGMILARGCASRLTVLGATGNLRALTVMAIFAVVAHATLKGVLAPVRTTLASVTLPLGDATSLSALPGGALLWTSVIALGALAIALTSGNRAVTLGLAALLGLLVPAAWVGPGYVLYDDFDAIPLDGLSFTAPWADALFFSIASSAIPANFGVGLIGGTLVGALVTSLVGKTFRWQSFNSPRETGRYAAGAVLMGLGGVVAGGCTIGAGLAGIPTLSVAAILTLVAIAAGALATQAVLGRSPAGTAVPAE